MSERISLEEKMTYREAYVNLKRAISEVSFDGGLSAIGMIDVLKVSARHDKEKKQVVVKLEVVESRKGIPLNQLIGTEADDTLVPYARVVVVSEQSGDVYYPDVQDNNQEIKSPVNPNFLIHILPRFIAKAADSPCYPS